MESFQPKPFGKYFLLEKLATGGMAEIYKAKTFGVDGFEKLLAIKRILPHCSADKEFITMLIDEAKLSVLLSHTNIVQVYDLGKVRDDYFISMEYIEGSNLREALNRGKELGEKLDEELAVYIISEVCKGLDYAHSKKGLDGKPLNIVHRDISPQNILLSFEGEVKIVDFGIAKAAMNISHTMAGILKGKISYMSPEQALGKPVDNKTDIFSTGLMLYEFLTGEKLFTGETQFEVLKKIRSTRITEQSLPDTISAPVRKILAKALAYSPRERYETASDFQIDLTRYLYSTYVDFTPRKLAQFMRRLFAEEIENKKNIEQAVPPLDSQTRSILIDSANQENIVHREGTGEAAFMAGQNTQTFAKPLGDGTNTRTGAEVTRTQQGFENVQGKFPGTYTGAAPRKSRAVLVSLFTLLAALGVFLIAYYKTDVFRPQAAVTGKLYVSTIPEGAQIFINDRETNYLTPATVANLPVGREVTVTIKKPKYETWTKTLLLLDDKTVYLEPTLKVIPVGSIKVQSSPPGAKIFVDGKDTGKKTPAVIEDLPLSQTYKIRLELEKYRIVEDSMTLYSLDQKPFEKTLEEIQYAPLKITSSPSGARVFIDGRDTGQKTPATVSQLEVGRGYSVRLALSEYQDAFRSIEIEKGGSSISSKLSKEPPPTTPEVPPTIGTPKPPDQPTVPVTPTQPSTPDKNERPTTGDTAYVSVAANESGASVFINGVRKGSAPGRYPVKPGSAVRVSVSKDGYRTSSQTVTLKPGETRSLSVNLIKTQSDVVKPPDNTEPKPPDSKPPVIGKPIRILIDSDPTGAKVTLNGGQSSRTPLRINNAKSGSTYTFTVTQDGYKTWSRTVTAGDKDISLNAKLQKE